jgi:uncharacterized OsmC-like protein
MTADELRALQAPLKTRYREDPAAARVVLRAEARLVPDRVACEVDRKSPVVAGLHPATGGDGSFACSGDMLLEALAACAGVTACAVATATSTPLRGGKVSVEGDIDFRGTLGDKGAPVGFTAIRLRFDFEGDLSAEQAATLVKLSERYCVVAQTLRAGVPITVTGGGGS